MRALAWVFSFLVAGGCLALAVPLVAYALHLQDSRLMDGLALGLALWGAGIALPAVLAGLRLEGRIAGAATEIPILAALLGVFFLFPDPVARVSDGLTVEAPVARLILGVSAAALAVLAAASGLGCLLDDRRKRRQAARPRREPALHLPVPAPPSPSPRPASTGSPVDFNPPHDLQAVIVRGAGAIPTPDSTGPRPDDGSVDS